MPVFPSGEWMMAFCAELASHPRAAEAASHLGGIYRFVVDPAGPLTDQHVYAMALTARDGGAEVTPVDRDVPPRVGIRMDYERWRQLLEGRLDVGRAMLLGRMRISGDLGALLNARSDLDVLVDALRAVDTVWFDAPR